METRIFSTRFVSDNKATQMFNAAQEMGFEPWRKWGIAPNGRTYTAIIVDDVTDEQFETLAAKAREINA